MTLNNPLVLLSLYVLGFGLEIGYERDAAGWSISLGVQALVWSRIWGWDF